MLFNQKFSRVKFKKLKLQNWKSSGLGHPLLVTFQSKGKTKRQRGWDEKQRGWDENPACPRAALGNAAPEWKWSQDVQYSLNVPVYQAFSISPIKHTRKDYSFGKTKPNQKSQTNLKSSGPFSPLWHSHICHGIWDIGTSRIATGAPMSKLPQTDIS